MNPDERKVRDAFQRNLEDLRPSTPIESIRRGTRRGRIVTALATALLVAMAGIGSYAITRSSEENQDRVVGPGPEASEGQATPSPDSTVPTPVFENLNSGWTKLESPPEARTDAVTVWSGRQPSGRDLVMWGGSSGYGGTVHDNGYSWDPDTNAWTTIAESPLAGRAEAGAAFTGTEIVIWGGYSGQQRPLGDGAAYDPQSDSWRLLPDAPIPPAIPVATVWTGEEVLVWGSTDRSAASRAGAAYNPTTNQWRRLPDAPAAINLGTAVWTGGDSSRPQEMIVFGAELDNSNVSELDHGVGIAHDPASDKWRELPDVALSPQASAIAWTGEEVIAWDYDLAAAAYDPAADDWRQIPPVPIDYSECYPATEFIGAYVFAWFCGDAALWDPETDSWSRIETPERIVPGEPVAAGEVLLFAGATHESGHNSLWVYVPPSSGP